MQEIRRFKPSTVSRRFSVTAGFYRTCVLDGALEHSPPSMTSAACMVMRSTACTVSVSRSGCSSGIRGLSCIATGQIADMVRVC
jgi:hypothetical protein